MKIRLNPNRHRGGFFLGGTKATTTNVDARTAASEGSLALGQGAQLIESGAIGHDLIAGDISITTADPGVMKAALSEFRAVAGQANASLADASIAQSATLGEALTRLADLQETDRTGGLNRTVALLLGVLLLLGVVFWKGFKK